jgi:hypothetical protein
MNKYLPIAGLLMLIFFCIVPLKRKMQEYDVQKNGEIVMAIIVSVPNSIGAKIHYSIKFAYAGRVFNKKTGNGVEKRYKLGDEIRLKHIDGMDIFLYEDEKIEKEFIAMAILAVVSIAFIIYGFQKKRTKV